MDRVLLGAGGTGRVFQEGDRVIKETPHVPLGRYERQALVELGPLGLAPALHPTDTGSDRELVMEYVAGQTLEKLGTVQPRLAADLGAALAQIHKAGWTHGDVNAGNVLITSGGVIFIDWGTGQPSVDSPLVQQDLQRLVELLVLYGTNSGEDLARLAYRAYAEIRDQI